MSEIKTASGSIVTIGEKDTITDVKSLTVDLEPIQDLNGYDKPWIGGAGKNKLPPISVPSSVNGLTITKDSKGIININGTTTAATYFEVGDFSSNAPTAGTYIFSGSVGGSGTTWRLNLYRGNEFISQSANGDAPTRVTLTASDTTVRATIYINSGVTLNNVKFYPMLRLASETDDTYEPYENICPISGHTDVVVSRTGKNLLNPTLKINASLNTITGAITVGTSNRVVVNKMPVAPNTQITVSVQSPYQIGSACVYDGSGNYLQTIVLSAWTDGSYTFSIPSEAHYFATNFRKSDNANISPSDLNVQIEFGSTATAYEPYQGNTYTTALGRTVYGGTLDVTSGVLTVDKGFASVTEITSASTNTSGKNRWQSSAISDAVAVSSGSVTADLLSNEFTPISADETYRCITGVALHPNKRLFIYNEEWATKTATEVNALLASNPIQVVYPLATPQTYQLTAQQIEALLGVNNLWASAGDITVKYTENILMNESVSINGKYLEAIIDGYLTLGTSGRRSLGRELDTYSVGSADGETVKGERFPSRKIKVNYVIQSDSEEELINSVNQLNNILNQDEADFIFRDEPDKFFTGLALLDAEPKKYRHAVKGTWTLYCAYPFKRSVEPITLVSTTDASISGNTATFVFDYNGTRPARPVLRARFASAKSGGDYTEDGDCGFVAFVDGDEHIVQLGNPDVIDVDATNKNEALVNSELDAFTGWTNSGKSITSITDQFWENGKGQTQNYASGNGYIRRNIASTIGFEYDMVHRLCVSDPSQIGTFKVLLKNGNKTVVGFSIEKTGSGTGGTVKYIINDKTVGTDNIDLSYYNPHFGYCNRSPVYVAQTYYTQVVTYVKKKKKKKKKKVVSWVANTRWVQNGWSYTQSNLNSGISRDGGVVTFSVGELADRTFKSSDIDTMACTSLSIESTGSFNTNAVRSVALVRKAGVPFAEIPNVFTSGDVVEGDCNSANVYLHRKGSTIGHLEPQYGALGNDWEDFELKPGRNAIRAVWSNWVNANYKPVIEITYNEVFL